jgi:Leucine-rich repeat (LRR) protein
MRRFTTLLAVFCWQGCTNSASNAIGCSSVFSRVVHDINIRALSCSMAQGVVVEFSNISIASNYNETVTEMFLDYNKHIHFLPIEVFKTFPKIFSYTSYACNLTTINKENFVNLIELKRIALNHNSISHIASHTFEGLIKLTHLFLDNNKIVELDPKIFDSLKALEMLNLATNVCINKNFVKPKPVEVFEFLSQNCSKNFFRKKSLVPITEEDLDS